ncbi:MAG: NAD(P)H-dependent oxidoreductase subunit E, partial [Acidimicrobiia bacterium]
MDLRFSGAEASEAERAALDAVEAVAGPRGSRRHLLLPALHAIHDVTGWISPGGMDEVARRLDVAPAEVYGVASFYALFSLRPRPSRVLHVCVDLACRLAGAERLVEEVTQRCGPAGSEIGGGEAVGVPTATWAESPCLG